MPLSPCKRGHKTTKSRPTKPSAPEACGELGDRVRYENKVFSKYASKVLRNEGGIRALIRVRASFDATTISPCVQNFGKTLTSRRGRRSSAKIESRKINRSSARANRRRLFRSNRAASRGEVFGVASPPLTLPIDDPVIFNAKNQVASLQCADILNVLHVNIESVRVPGRLFEVLSCLEEYAIKLAILSEAWVEGSSFFSMRAHTGQLFFIFQSGAVREYNESKACGVVFIIHAELYFHLHSFSAISGRLASCVFKVKGGFCTFFGVYMPYASATESAARETYRQDVFQELEDHVEMAKVRGPVFVIGDLNTSVQYRYQSEANFFGPFLFSPHSLGTQIAPFFDDADDPPHFEVDTPNRQLLGQVCEAGDLVVKNTFLSKATAKKATFAIKGADRPSGSGITDFTQQKELDLVLVSQKYTNCVTNIVSLFNEQIGGTTHIPQKITVSIPLFSREKVSKEKSPSIPKYFFDSPELLGLVTAATIAEIDRKGLAFSHGALPPQNMYPETPESAICVVEELSTVRLYIDGSGPDDDHPCAGWGFVCTVSKILPGFVPNSAPVPLYRNGRVEYIIMARYGPVETNPSKFFFLGAEHHSNNTGEHSAWGEALLFYLFELPAPFRDSQLSIFGDSTLVLKQGSGDWKIKENSVLKNIANISHKLWKALGADFNQVASQWVRAHRNDPGNNLVDSYAKKGRSVYSNCQRPQSLLALNPALDQLCQHYLVREPTDWKLSRFTAQTLYNKFCEIHDKVNDFLQNCPAVPFSKPKKTYHDATFLRMLDARRDAIARGEDAACIRHHTKMLEKHAKNKKKAAIFELLENPRSNEVWAGVRRLKPFKATETRLRDSRGRLVGTHKRAQTFADHYANVQWAEDPEVPHPFPQRPHLFPPAGLSAAPFSPVELRSARQRLKRKKASGVDNISNEFLNLFLSTREGFALILELMNECWSTKTLPDKLHIARIVAIFKKGQPLPANFRPISLLCTLYKLFTTLFALRLEEKVSHRISKNQFAYQKKKSVDSAVFRLLRTLENAANWKNLDVFMLLLDWVKCFDRIHKVPLLNSLERLGIEKDYIEMLDHIYSSKSFFVRDPFGESSLLRQVTGLAQGDPLSCILLNCLTTVIMHDAENDWQDDFHRNFPQANFFKSCFGFDHVLFADDTNLVNSSLLGIRAMLHAVEKQALLYGLRLNFDKTTLLRLGPARLLPPPALRALRGQPVLEKDIEKTLGHLLGSANTTRLAVKSKVRDMFFTAKQFKLIWKSKLSQKKKLEKFQSLVVSKTWGVHLLALGVDDFRKLDSVYTRCVRRILGIKAAYISRISNEDVMKKAAIPTLYSIIRQKQFALFGHVLRLSQADTDWRVCFQPGTNCSPCLPDGIKKRQGRPRAQWAEILFQLFQDKFPQYSRANIVALAQERNRWRAASWRLSMS